MHGSHKAHATTATWAHRHKCTAPKQTSTPTVYAGTCLCTQIHTHTMPHTDTSMHGSHKTQMPAHTHNYTHTVHINRLQPVCALTQAQPQGKLLDTPALGHLTPRHSKQPHRPLWRNPRAAYAHTRPQPRRHTRKLRTNPHRNQKQKCPRNHTHGHAGTPRVHSQARLCVPHALL